MTATSHLPARGLALLGGALAITVLCALAGPVSQAAAGAGSCRNQALIMGIQNETQASLSPIGTPSLSGGSWVVAPPASIAVGDDEVWCAQTSATATVIANVAFGTGSTASIRLRAQADEQDDVASAICLDNGFVTVVCNFGTGGPIGWPNTIGAIAASSGTTVARAFPAQARKEIVKRGLATLVAAKASVKAALTVRAGSRRGAVLGRASARVGDTPESVAVHLTAAGRTRVGAGATPVLVARLTDARGRVRWSTHTVHLLD